MCINIFPRYTNFCIPVGLDSILRRDVSALILGLSKFKYLLMMRERTIPGRKVAWATKFCTEEPTVQHNYRSTFLMYTHVYQSSVHTHQAHKVTGNFKLTAHSLLIKTVLRNMSKVVSLHYV
jgi:hypothetical protein